MREAGTFPPLAPGLAGPGSRRSNECPSAGVSSDDMLSAHNLPIDHPRAAPAAIDRPGRPDTAEQSGARLA